MTLIPNDYEKGINEAFEISRKEIDALKAENKELNKQLRLHSVSNRFSISKTILSDFTLFAIIDNQQNKVVCNLVYDNGEQYCDEMANKMLAGLNGC